MSDELLPVKRTALGSVIYEYLEYFPATLLANMNLDGLPGSRVGIYDLADKEKWEYILVPGKGKKDGVRYYRVPDYVHALIDSWRENSKYKDGAATPSLEYGKAKSSAPLVPGSGKQAGIKLQDHHAAPEAPSAPDGFVLVPRYDVAASMGNGAVIHSEQVVDHLAFRAEWVRTELGTSPRNLILISAIGDSMEPSLRAGDLLLIDRSVESVKQDSIYAIAHDGELRIKRIQRLFDGSLVIKSDNPSYRTEELSPAQAEQMRIVGRVVWSGRRM